LELYGTFNAMGVIVSIAATDDPNQKAIASIEYRTGDKPYRAGFPLTRVSQTQFVGSLFWLVPATTYDVRVTFVDPGGQLNCTTLQASASTRAEITVPTPKNSYYVSPDGSGSTCTQDAPCPLTIGINRAAAGDAVVLRGGVYYDGEIRLPRSGRADAPIVIQSYPGEKAILDGADPATFKWTSVGNGIYRTAVNVSDFDLVVANDQRLYPYKNMADLQSLRWGIPGFYAEGNSLHVHLADNSDPNNAAMVIPRKSYGFWVQQNFIYFLNLAFRHYGQGVYGFGIYFFNGSDNLVQGSVFSLNRVGITVKLESHRNLIQNNEFSDALKDWPWDAVYDGTRFPGNSGVRITQPNPDQGNVIARGNVIRRNVFHDTFDGFGVCPNQNVGTTTNETDVYENIVYNVGDDGMETDGLCSNVRIWSNTFHDSLTGISLAPARVGPTYAIRNLIYRTGRPTGCPFNGLKGPCGGTAFKFQYQFPGSGPMYLFHNTFDANSPAESGLYISKPSSWPILVSRNNIWSVTCNPIGDTTGNPMDFDYDALWTSGNCNMVIWNGVRYRTLEQFVAAIGQERHGLSVAPGFADSTKSDYRLLPNSKLIDAGVFIPGINDDFKGRAPDIGAFEF